MKKILLAIITIFLVAPVWAQIDRDADQERYGKGKMPRNNKGEVVFSKIIQEDSIEKITIYKAAKLTITNMFNSAKDVIQLDDPESGIIIVKGFTEEPSRGLMGTVQNAEVWFTLKIQTKDSRYKIDIYQIKGHYPGGMVNGIYLSPTDWPAETLTYEACFKPNGKMMTAREGFYRRAIIDGCNRLLKQLEKNIQNNLTPTSIDESDNW